MLKMRKSPFNAWIYTYGIMIPDLNETKKNINELKIILSK